MGWQADVYDRLKTGEWVTLAELFAMAELRMELHLAMRRVAVQKKKDPLEAGISINEARWIYFVQTLGVMRVESDPPGARNKYQDGQVKIRLMSSGTCGTCGTVVYRKTWTSWGVLFCPSCNMCFSSNVDRTAARSKKVVTLAPPRRVCLAIIKAAEEQKGLDLTAKEVQELSRMDSIRSKAITEGYWQSDWGRQPDYGAVVPLVTRRVVCE